MKSIRCALAASLMLAAIFETGCGARTSAAPLDTAKAREALKTTLDAWKTGADASTLKSNSPAIVAQDLEWLGGAKLLDYQIEGEGTPVDSNLRVPVKLTLKTQDGGETAKNVNYLVGTSPALTVFRSF
jgi:hypothetical protein